jgi:hypothetical protein
MKQLVRAFAVILTLGAACLPASSALPNCRYWCGNTPHTVYSTSCCTQTFICPNGQPAQVVQEYSYSTGGSLYCP